MLIVHNYVPEAFHILLSDDLQEDTDSFLNNKNEWRYCASSISCNGVGFEMKRNAHGDASNLNSLGQKLR